MGEKEFTSTALRLRLLIQNVLLPLIYEAEMQLFLACRLKIGLTFKNIATFTVMFQRARRCRSLFE